MSTLADWVGAGTASLAPLTRIDPPSRACRRAPARPPSRDSHRALLRGHETHAAVCCERTLTPPFDLAGGLSGSPMRLWLELPDGAVQRLNSKGSFRVPAGARLVMEAPGSGGYGPPPARDEALVHEDCADGYVTPRAVRAG